MYSTLGDGWVARLLLTFAVYDGGDRGFVRSNRLTSHTSIHTGRPRWKFYCNETLIRPSRIAHEHTTLDLFSNHKKLDLGIAPNIRIRSSRKPAGDPANCPINVIARRFIAQRYEDRE